MIALKGNRDGYTFVSEIFEFVTKIIEQSVSKNVERLIPFIAEGLFAGLGVYSCYVTYCWFISRPEVLKDAFGNFLLLGVVMFWSMNGGYYIDIVVPFVLSVGDEIGGAIVGSKGVDSGLALDTFLTEIYFAIKNILLNAEWGNMGVSFFNAALLFFGSVPFIVTTFGILLTAKIMVSILLSVGVLFIGLAFFKQTRHWFMQWVGLCFNYIMLAILFPIALSIEMVAIQEFVVFPEEGSISMASGVKLLVITLGFLSISVQIPVLASSLSGGVGINGMSGSFSTMLGGVSKVAQTLSKSAGLVGKGVLGVGSKIKNAYGQRGNNVRSG